MADLIRVLGEAREVPRPRSPSLPPAQASLMLQPSDHCPSGSRRQRHPVLTTGRRGAGVAMDWAAAHRALPVLHSCGLGAGWLACPVPTVGRALPRCPESRWPVSGVQHLRGADAPEAALAEGDGGIAAAAALVVVALDVAAGRAAALTVGVIGPGAAAPVAVGVLGAGAVAELAVALIFVRAGEAGAVSLRGEEELAAQAGA